MHMGIFYCTLVRYEFGFVENVASSEQFSVIRGEFSYLAGPQTV